MTFTFSATALIDATEEQVWPVMADVVRWPEWLPTVAEVLPLGQAALSVGGRFRVFQPRLRPAVWSVVILDPPTGFTWESRAPGVRTVASHILHTDAGGSTRVTLTITFSGPLKWLAGMVAGRLTLEYMEQEVAALTRRVESRRARR